MLRAFGFSVIAVLPLLAQLPPGVPPDLRFEVASLKPSAADLRSNNLIRPLPGGQRYDAVNAPFRDMLQVAFRIRPEQIMGIPGWLDSQRFDMEAKTEKPSSPDELHVMLLNLLADRMHLQYHVEKREMQRYALVVAKGGAKLKPRESAAGDADVAPNGHDLEITMKGTNARMDLLAFRLSNGELDRPVVDMTGLKGTYDFELDYTREPRDNGPNTAGPNLFAALKRQLGLELQADKGPIAVIVVDHVERLSAN